MSSQAGDFLLVIDIILKSHSDEHAWAQKARQEDFTTRILLHFSEKRDFPGPGDPDIYEQSMRSVFPGTESGTLHLEWGGCSAGCMRVVFITTVGPEVLLQSRGADPDVDINSVLGQSGCRLLRPPRTLMRCLSLEAACQAPARTNASPPDPAAAQRLLPGHRASVLFHRRERSCARTVEVTKYFGGRWRSWPRECRGGLQRHIDGVCSRMPPPPRNAKLLCQGLQEACRQARTGAPG